LRGSRARSFIWSSEKNRFAAHSRGEPPMRPVGVFAAILCTALAAGAARAEQPTIEELISQIKVLKQRVDELEGREHASSHPAGGAPRAAAASRVKNTSKRAPAAPVPVAGMPVVIGAPVPAVEVAAPPIAALRPPERMGEEFEDALRSDLPGLS